MSLLTPCLGGAIGVVLFNIALGRLIDNPITFPIQLSLVRDILIQTYRV